MQKFRSRQVTLSRENVGSISSLDDDNDDNDNNDDDADDEFRSNKLSIDEDNHCVSRLVACFSAGQFTKSGILYNTRKNKRCSCAEYATLRKDDLCVTKNGNKHSCPGEELTAEHCAKAENYGDKVEEHGDKAEEHGCKACIKTKTGRTIFNSDKKSEGRCISSSFTQHKTADQLCRMAQGNLYQCQGCCELDLKQNEHNCDCTHCETLKNNSNKLRNIRASHVNIHTKASKDDSSNCNRDLKERDEIIKDYQLQQMIKNQNTTKRDLNDAEEYEKLRRSYNNLKKMFLVLAILNMILILFVVSIMPVILVTFKLHGDEDIESKAEKHLSSDKVKEVVKEHVFCVDCKRINDELSNIFTRIDGKGCCLTDIAELAERILNIHEKNLNSMVSTKMKYYLSKRNGEKHAPHSNFTEPEVTAFPESESEKIYRLINTLLTRKRSAMHLSGTFRSNTLAWTKSFPEKLTGKLKQQNDAIRVENGGVYFLYSSVRFRVGQCDRKYVGYKVVIQHGMTSHGTVASIRHACKGGNNTETDLIIQKVIEVPVKKTGTTLRVEVDSSPNLVSNHHQHYFGLFEI